MGEFVSKLEEIMPIVELNFEPTPAFGEYKQYLEHAISHPAKANTKLLEFLILNFTEEGDVILDPMAGSGSTGVVAALHGRNAIQVDIEPKFYEFMEKARENVEKTLTLTPKGWIKNILGDARHLSKLLEQADVCITSPPYGETYLSGGDPEKRKERLIKAGYDPREFLGGKARNAVLKHYSEVDAIITSPPYADTKRGGETDGEAMAERWDEKFKETGETWNSWGKTWKTPGRLRALEALGSGYSENKDNIGNLPLGNVDVIITSPPYEDGLSHRRHHTPNTGRTEKLWSEKHLGAYPDEDELDETIKRLRSFGRSNPKAGGPYGRSLAHPYSPNRDNIGNLRSSDDEYQALSEGRIQELAKKLMKNGKPTYLSEMLKVYHEMYKALKPSGRAIIIIKPFIRNKKVIDLPYYTYLLMSYCGFTLEKLYKLRLKTSRSGDCYTQRSIRTSHPSAMNMF